MECQGVGRDLETGTGEVNRPPPREEGQLLPLPGGGR